MSTLKRLVILRHGETDWNAGRRLNSFTDTSLNEAGRREVARLASERAYKEFAIISSPAMRALQTSTTLLGRPPGTSSADSRIAVDPRLCELNFGVLEGATPEAIDEMGRRQEFVEWLEDRGAAPAEAEPLGAAAARARSFFNSLRQSEKECVLVVSHGHFARILLCVCVLGSAAGHHRRMRLDNSRFADIRMDGEMPRLVGFNTTALEL